jgi:DNA-binding SARP family transcriptional activator
MAGRETEGEHRAALETALHLLGRDPLREEAHRVAMRAYCRPLQRNVALEQYHRCREIVRELIFLPRCRQRAKAQEGGPGLISGEAGVGRACLVEAFAERLRW